MEKSRRSGILRRIWPQERQNGYKIGGVEDAGRANRPKATESAASFRTPPSGPAAPHGARTPHGPTARSGNADHRHGPSTPTRFGQQDGSGRPARSVPAIPAPRTEAFGPSPIRTTADGNRSPPPIRPRRSGHEARHRPPRPTTDHCPDRHTPDHNHRRQQPGHFPCLHNHRPRPIFQPGPTVPTTAPCRSTT